MPLEWTQGPREKMMDMGMSSKVKKFRSSRWNEIERWNKQKALKYDRHGHEAQGSG